MTEQISQKKETVPAELNLFTRTVLTLDSCIAIYVIVATHFLFSVRTAHLFGDISYIPPSILRYTDVIFQQGDVESGVQIFFFIFWLVLVLASCAAVFMAASFLMTTVTGFFTSDKSLEAAIWDCVSNAFLCLLPVLILSLLTLLIMPLESHHPASDSASLTQVGELMPFSEFLFMMTQATFLIFLVCFMVVLTCMVAYLLSFILPDDSGFFFFVSMFIGVCVGVATIFVLAHYGNIGFEFIKLKTGSAYLTHYLVFGIYAILCAVLILPSMLKEKKRLVAEIKSKRQLKKLRKNQMRQGADAVVNC